MTPKTLFSIGLLLLVQTLSQAQAPERISFQGKVDSGGLAVTDTLAITFTLYDSMGSNLWSENHPAVSIIDGVFSVVLGDLQSLAPLDFAHAYKIGISVDSDPEMVPRSEMTSVPYALNLRNLRVFPATAERGPTMIGGSYANGAPNHAGGATISGGGVAGSSILLDSQCDPYSGDLHNFAGSSWSTIGGGYKNYTCMAATIGGGGGNSATGDYSTISGGISNEASGTLSAIGGGSQNVASGDYASVPGGLYNEASGDYSFAGGLQAKALHTGTFVWADSMFGLNSEFASTDKQQFLIRARGGVGIGTNSPGSQLTVNGMIESESQGFKFPDGTVQTTAAAAGDSWSLAGNSGTDPATNFLGTTDSTAFEIRTNSLRRLRIEPTSGTINNLSTPVVAPNIIGGAPNNTMWPTVAGGIIGGGGGIVNGIPRPNTVTHSYGIVVGGWSNTAGERAVVAGGASNTADGTGAAIGGGSGNEASGQNATIGGGANNTASGSFQAVVCGGQGNTASGSYSTACGGQDNAATATESTVGGGRNNQVDGVRATVPGGFGNLASGDYGFAAGFQADAQHEGSFVWSDRSIPTVGVGIFQSTGANQFLIRAAGGVGIGTNDPRAALTVRGPDDSVNGPTLYFTGNSSDQVESGRIRFVEATGSSNWRGAYIHYDGSSNNDFHIGVHDAGDSSTASDLDVITIERNTGDLGIRNPSPGYSLHVGTDGTNGNGAHVTDGGVWTNGSSRSFKTNFETIDEHEVLDQLASIPITEWEYKGSDEGRHLGPVAEDFYEAFGLGSDNRYIGTIDAAGVSMAAIQALYDLVRAQQATIALQNDRISALESALSAMD